MTANRNDTLVDALQDVLDAMLGPINQLFFHSHMMRAWGHSEAVGRNAEWIEKMRRAKRLVTVLDEYDARPRSRAPQDLEIGADSRAVFESDAAQTRRFIGVVDRTLVHCETGGAKKVLDNIIQTERQDLARIETWLSGPQARETPRNAKHLMPKPGGAAIAVARIDMALPPMTAAVSQFFYYSLIFAGQGKTDLAERELNAAVLMMFRTQALLERLLDLGGLPGGGGHGGINICDGEGSSDETALVSHQTIISTLNKALADIDGFIDPMTHTLIDGVLRAEHDEATAINHRLGRAVQND